jgi:hypothetical protein
MLFISFKLRRLLVSHENRLLLILMLIYTIVSRNGAKSYKPPKLQMLKSQNGTLLRRHYETMV